MPPCLLYHIASPMLSHPHSSPTSQILGPGIRPLSSFPSSPSEQQPQLSRGGPGGCCLLSGPPLSVAGHIAALPVARGQTSFSFLTSVGGPLAKTSASLMPSSHPVMQDGHMPISGDGAQGMWGAWPRLCGQWASDGPGHSAPICLTPEFAVVSCSALPVPWPPLPPGTSCPPVPVSANPPTALLL